MLISILAACAVVLCASKSNAVPPVARRYAFLALTCCLLLSYGLIGYMSGTAKKAAAAGGSAAAQISAFLYYRFDGAALLALFAATVSGVVFLWAVSYKALPPKKEIIKKDELKIRAAKELLPVLNHNLFCNCVCLLGLLGIAAANADGVFKIAVFAALLAVTEAVLLFKTARSKRFYQSSAARLAVEALYIATQTVFICAAVFLFAPPPRNMEIVILLIMFFMGDYFAFDRGRLLDYISGRAQNGFT
ncbi:MAG: hypothetical protein LBP26_01935 [Clostridiales bacterium]|nr:hypothetical protein [Clostridiales bacterium]